MPRGRPKKEVEPVPNEDLLRLAEAVEKLEKKMKKCC